MGALASKVLDPVMRKRAGINLDLIAHWPEIVGEDRARLSRPREVKWSKQASAEDAYVAATLFVTCAPAVALIVQHDTDAIRSKVNAFFGFEAVGRVVVEQGQVDLASTPKPQDKSAAQAAPSEHIKRQLERVEDPDLKAALTKMGRGVFSSSSGKSS